MGKDELQERDGSSSTGTVIELTDTNGVRPAEREYYKQAKALQEGRIRYAQAFMIAKAQGGSDELAKQRAIEMTGDEVTLLGAALRIAESRL